VILILIGLPLLTGCGVQAQADLKTRLNALGWGQHEMVLSVPGEFYDGTLFDQLPDFSLITGVQVQDYRAGGRQGIQVTQSFYRLGRLNDDPERTHFLNKAFPGAPVTFRATWQPGLFTHGLEVKVFFNTVRSNALAEGISTATLSLLNTSFTLEMPGRVIQHNGNLVDERTVTWDLDPSMPQTLEATARVVSVPFLTSLAFTLGSGGFAVYTARAGRGGSSSRPPGGSGRPLLRPAEKPDRRPSPPSRPKRPLPPRRR